MTTENQNNLNEQNTALMAHLVVSLATSAMQHLGKLVDPASKKAEINLEAAQSTIDMLDMLEAKMKGNLDAEEERFLKSTISTLKMNFVETAQSADSSPTPPLAEEKGRASEDGNIQEPKKSDDERRRFHKKYE